MVFTIIPTATYMMELGRMVSKKEKASCCFLVETGSKVRIFRFCKRCRHHSKISSSNITKSTFLPWMFIGQWKEGKRDGPMVLTVPSGER